MQTWHYYNDFDEAVCEWLRKLIRRGLLPGGYVDQRSILEVRPEDLDDFTSCHFFAGIGGWPYALRLAGWPDDRPVWTGSAPCQPFSSAGKQKGREDSRHLAPAWLELIRACRPGLVFGEQVASAEVFGKASSKSRKAAQGASDWCWLDDLSDGLEASHYAIGSSDLPAACVGAPHIRQRLFFGAVDLWRLGAEVGGVDYAASARSQPERRGSEIEARNEARLRGPEFRCRTGRLADADNAGSQGRGFGGDGADQRAAGPAGVAGRLADPNGRDACAEGLQRGGQHGFQSSDSGTGRLAHAARDGRGEERQDGSRGSLGDRTEGRPARLGPSGGDQRAGEAHGGWRDADWLFCRDGKWRPVEPGSFPLADGIPARVGRLRGYGNAINPQAAAEFIRAFDASLDDLASGGLMV